MFFIEVRQEVKSTNSPKKQASMIRKYHNHTKQTNPQHREEESQNTDCHKTPGRQLKQNRNLFLPHQDDCKTRRTQSTEYKTRTILLVRW